jgi:hypothetical protein
MHHHTQGHDTVCAPPPHVRVSPALPMDGTGCASPSCMLRPGRTTCSWLAPPAPIVAIYGSRDEKTNAARLDHLDPLSSVCSAFWSLAATSVLLRGVRCAVYFYDSVRTANASVPYARTALQLKIPGSLSYRDHVQGRCILFLFYLHILTAEVSVGVVC